MPDPPDFAQGLLLLILRADARETVCGDLLEEYRESRVPALGERRADLWYWRQVGGIWLRAHWWIVAPLILLFVVADIFNTFRAPSGASYLHSLPVPAPPLGLLVVGGYFVMAGAYGTLRTRDFGGGLLAALGTFVALWLFMAIWGTATFYPFAHVQQSNPYWIQAWQWSTHRAHSTEGFRSWIFWDGIGAMFYGGLAMLSVSAIGGAVGSAFGLIARRQRPPAVLNS